MQYQTEAVLANLAYQEPLLRRRSTSNTFLYNDPHSFALLQPNNEIVITFRGTQDLEDVATDVLLGLGGEDALKKSYKYKKARELVKSIQSVLPQNPIKLVGHSLGGSVAHQLGKELNVQSVAFNPGSSPLSGKKTLAQDVIAYAVKEGDTDDPKHVVLRNAWDPISYFEKDVSHVISHPEDPHSIRPFIS